MLDPTERQNIAGMSFGGGRKENFFFCLLEFFPQKKRWFLANLHQIKGEEKIGRDKAISDWTHDYELQHIMIDFPWGTPPCLRCELDCPGIELCPHEDTVNVRKQIDELLATDEEMQRQDPKSYEEKRKALESITYGRDLLAKESVDPILSRSFKRRLKKGFLPYWNRPLDVWVWKHYYDLLLKVFNVSYDSYGTVSLMLVHRFQYLQKHLPKTLNVYEVSVVITLIELFRSEILPMNLLKQLQDIQTAASARLEIIRRIEQKLRIFIYEHDLELLVKNPKAFDSFLLSLAGQRLLLQQTRQIPEWANKEQAPFIVPQFSAEI